MRTNEEIEAFLLQMGCQYTSPESGIWVIHDEYDHIENIVVCNTPPVITFRVKLMEMPENARRAELCELLLEKNASEMVAGAYGIEDGNIVIVDTLQAESLDLNELQASVDGLSMAISLHYSILSKFLEQQSPTMSDAEGEKFAAFDAQLNAGTAASQDA